MQKTNLALVFGLAGLAAGSWLSTASSAAGTSYSEDRAQIEDLQARYLFALDFHDPKLYASTFTPDGILDYGEGDVKGRDEDEMVKVKGQWFFTKRKIFNEGSARWQYKGDRNPAW